MPLNSSQYFVIEYTSWCHLVIPLFQESSSDISIANSAFGCWKHSRLLWLFPVNVDKFYVNISGGKMLHEHMKQLSKSKNIGQ